MDETGGEEQQEKVFNVAWSDERVPRADETLPAVGNSVDLQTGKVANTIGASELAVVWQDPDFSAAQSAFYYARVLQIPTARHSLLDAIALGQQHAAEQPDTIQERAYSSSIWYSPPSN